MIVGDCLYRGNLLIVLKSKLFNIDIHSINYSGSVVY